METITYYYRGTVERGNGKPGYSSHPGYSEGQGKSVTYPWMTRAECRQDARKRGAKAKFEGEGRTP
ncbi:MAG TPA: hypothetical protein VFU31_19365 [Candidatus Binatia bacterium]|nr:hypothetical protein [Candidatus Binatia bacterium]